MDLLNGGHGEVTVAGLGCGGRRGSALRSVRRWRLSTRGGGVAALATFLVVAVGAARPAVADDPCAQPSPPVDTGFAEVAVKLGAGTFNTVLPFDVPVRICGTVPTGTSSVSVQYAMSKTADLTLDASAATCTVVAPSKAQLLPTTPLTGRLDGTTFRVILPPLEADRYYAFCFSRQATIPDDAAMNFKAQAREALDLALLQVTSGSLTAQESRKLREELYRRLLAVAGAKVAIVKGTLFDTSDEHDELRGKFVGMVAQVLGPQRRVDRIVDGDPNLHVPSLAEQQKDFDEHLKAVRVPELAQLFSQLEKEAAQDPTLEAMLASKNLAAAKNLLGADGGQLALVAEGREAEEAAPNSRDPDQVAVMVGHYGDSSAALSALVNLIEKVIGAPPSSPFRAGLSAKDLAALRALVEPAMGPQAAHLIKARDAAFRLDGLAGNIQAALADRAKALDALAEKARIEAVGVQVVDASTTGNFATSQNNYISADAGLVYAPELKTALSYVGVNFYLRPVNKDANLAQLGDFFQTFSRRFALTLGLTVQSVADGSSSVPQTRQDLFGNQALILGAGLRVTSSFRFASGAIIFKEKDRNPLISKYSVAASYYFSLSFDLNVASAFKGGLGKLFGGSS
jgi:hypothetical protein